MMIKLVISGCCGRMGSRIAALAFRDSAFVIAGAIEAKGHQAIGQDIGTLIGMEALGVHVTDDVDRAIRQGDVLIEFTQPAATIDHVQVAKQLKKSAVVGTTGLSEAQRLAIVEAANEIPIVLSPNMSQGVNVLFELLRTASERLGFEYDVEVVEAHHRAKKDAPSGTAKRIVTILADARKQASLDIPIHSIRAGDIVGDHKVIFAGPAESLELVHRAHSRDTFALGALKAAQFVRSMPAGLYDMSDVLKRQTG